MSDSHPVSRGDLWLPDADVRVRHEQTAPVTPERLWQAASEVRVDETGRLGRLVRWRIPGLPVDVTFRQLFRDYPFVELEAGDTWSVSGLVGKIWTLRRDYPRLESPQEFTEWHRRGTVRVMFAHWAEPHGDGARLVSDCRVKAVDAFASVRLKALWRLIGVFERLIASEALAAVARRAQRN